MLLTGAEIDRHHSYASRDGLGGDFGRISHRCHVFSVQPSAEDPDYYLQCFAHAHLARDCCPTVIGLQSAFP